MMNDYNEPTYEELEEQHDNYTRYLMLEDYQAIDKQVEDGKLERLNYYVKEMTVCSVL